MSSKLIPIFLYLFYFSNQAISSELISGKGIVSGSIAGVFNIEGHALKAFEITTESKEIHRVLITEYTSTAIENGELIIYSGKKIYVDELHLINTSAGYIYRPNGLTQNEKFEKSSKDIPSAVTGIPVTTVLTKEQEQQQEDRELFEMWMGILSLLLGFLALDKFFVFIGWLWAMLKSFFSRKKY